MRSTSSPGHRWAWLTPLPAILASSALKPHHTSAWLQAGLAERNMK